MKSNNSNLYRFIVLIVVSIAIGGVIWSKNSNIARMNSDSVSSSAPSTSNDQVEVEPNTSVTQNIGKARMLDLGSVSCVACKAMIPVMDELKAEYPNDLQVDFIDVWKDNSAADKYRVSAIPTQIFYDKTGKELYRHIGAIDKKAILAKFAELGVSLSK